MDRIKYIILVGIAVFLLILVLLADNNYEKGGGKNKYPSDSLIELSVDHQSHGFTCVDLGLSVMWGTCNAGASTPTGCGQYVSWSNSDKYNYLADDEDSLKNTVLEPADDFITEDRGGLWRMPTLEEAQDLLDGCSWRWIDKFNGDGLMCGWLGTSKVNGHTIFFRVPQSACDYVYNCELLTSELSKRDCSIAYTIYMTPSYHSIARSYRTNSFLIRPVLGERHKRNKVVVRM